MIGVEENEDARRRHGPFIDGFFFLDKKRLQFEPFLSLNDPLDDPFGQGFAAR